jgi:hypothetical protein
MRRFEDSDGLAWDVVIGRASWGALLALFVPVDHDDPVRQAPLLASSMEAAADELDRMDSAALAALLVRSTPKDA